MNWGSTLVVAGLVALTVVSLSTKIAMQSAKPDAPPSGAEQAAVERLAATGWRPLGTQALTTDGDLHVRAFGSPLCTGALFLSAIPPNDEAAPLYRRLGGPDGHVVYLYHGRLFPALPTVQAYLEAKITPLLARLGLMGTARPPLAPVVIVTTGDCARPDFLPWPAAE